jgi:hypothetical protein
MSESFHFPFQFLRPGCRTVTTFFNRGWRSIIGSPLIKLVVDSAVLSGCPYSSRRFIGLLASISTYAWHRDVGHERRSQALVRNWPYPNDFYFYDLCIYFSAVNTFKGPDVPAYNVHKPCPFASQELGQQRVHGHL